MRKLTDKQKARFADALLWRQGSGAITLDCNDDGFFTFQCDHAEAQTEFYMADSPEALARLVLKPK